MEFLELKCPLSDWQDLKTNKNWIIFLKEFYVRVNANTGKKKNQFKLLGTTNQLPLMVIHDYNSITL